ncbi:zinc knuckle CX2CX4HX4C containing protein [Tanacetum coccineum]
MSSLPKKNSWGRISFARALIEICSVSDLKREVSMAVPNEDGIGHTREVIKVEYEWQPPRCTECKVFGHSHDKCPKRVNLETLSKNKDPVIPSNASTHSDGFTKVKKKKNKGTNVKGANMDNSNKVYTASISNSFVALNNMEEGASSSRNIQEDDLETGNTSQWNKDQESDNEVDEFIFLEGDKFGDKFDIRLKGQVRK